MKQPCTDPTHEPTCEGSALHIRGRCKNGCAQFRDGSWLTKLHCYEPHPGLDGGPRAAGDAEATRDWLEASFELNRQRR